MAFGEGLGAFLGAGQASKDIKAGMNAVGATAGSAIARAEPYNQFGQSFMPDARQGISDVRGFAGGTQGYDDFMARYETTPGVQYQMEQAQEAQNASAAARGQLLSGTNLRALDTITQGIAATGANNAYQQYLAGNSQQFGQLETALGNMFQAIGVGQTATGQQAGVASAEMAQQAALAKAQAENSRSKGSGLGSLFGGLTGNILKPMGVF